MQLAVVADGYLTTEDTEEPDVESNKKTMTNVHIKNAISDSLFWVE